MSRTRQASLGVKAALVVVIIVLLAVVVAPALAVPAETEWTVSPTSKIITYGQGVTLNGTLMSDSVAVGGLWVDLAQATTESGSFEVIYQLTTSTGAYATGTYSIAVMPQQTMYYRFQWAGDATYAAGNSDVVPVQVKPSLGKPSCPASIKRGKKFTVKGAVKPGEGISPAVKIKAYRKNSSGAYKAYRTYSATVSGTQYKASIKISKLGKYKFKAFTAGTAEFAAGASGLSRVLTVKK
jgi:hypothetical protein